MLGLRGYLFHCHAALFRRVPLPQSIRGQQPADLLHELRQILIPSKRKVFILFADELFCARKKGASQDFAFESVKRGVRIPSSSGEHRKYLLEKL